MLHSSLFLFEPFIFSATGLSFLSPAGILFVIVWSEFWSPPWTWFLVCGQTLVSASETSVNLRKGANLFLFRLRVAHFFIVAVNRLRHLTTLEVGSDKHRLFFAPCSSPSPRVRSPLFPDLSSLNKSVFLSQLTPPPSLTSAPAAVYFSSQPGTLLFFFFT